MLSHRRRCSADGDRRNDRADVRLEDIRTHSRHVANIVTDVVRNGRRVARINLGQDPAQGLIEFASVLRVALSS